MENMMLTAKILWRNGLSGVLFKVRWNSWQVSNFGVWESKSFCMLLLWSKTPQIWYQNVGFGELYPNKYTVDSIDMLISDLTRGQKVTDFDPRLKSS